MKLFLLGLAIIAGVCAQSSEYLPPVESYGAQVAPSNEYLAPALEQQSALFADDGYRYKTVKRFRHKRQATEYLPPVESYGAQVAPSNEYLAPTLEQQSALFADDGYRYKTVKRFRHKRQATEYLPPVESYGAQVAPSNEYLAPALEQQSALFADDGYRYKTVKRFRHKRQATEYLPPVESYAAQVAPSNEYLAPALEQQSALFADDGYRYKTVKRFRHKRQATEYLPPVESYGAQVAPSNEYLAPALEQQSALFADDGYRYKTVKRFRHKRQATEYLPPVESYAAQVAPSNEYLAPALEQQSALFADDGYRYKTVKRFRHKRQATEYLPPVESYGAQVAPSNEYLAPALEQQSALFADDGYRYKTVKRFRHKRQATEYLPPVESYAAQVAPSNEYLAPALEQQSALFADDGYRYKTVRKYKHRV